MVEHLLAKEGVEGSNPFFRSKLAAGADGNQDGLGDRFRRKPRFLFFSRGGSCRADELNLQPGPGGPGIILT